MKRNAFTLVELLVLIAIIGILIALIVPAIVAVFSDGGENPSAPGVTQSAPSVNQSERDALVNGSQPVNSQPGQQLNAQPQMQDGRYIVNIKGDTFEIMYQSRDSVTIRRISP